MGADVAAQRRGLEEAHVTVGTRVRLFRTLLVRLLVCFAVAHLREGFPAYVAEEGFLPGVHPRVADEFVEFAEGLHAVRALIGLPGLLGVCALMPLQPGRPIEYLPTVRTRMLVGLVVPVQVSGHLLLCHETLVALLTVINDLGLPGVHVSVPLQLGRPVEDFATDGAQVTLQVQTVAFRPVEALLLNVR